MLPILIAVPHAGTSVPSELAWYNQLTAEDLYYDHDVGAAELFDLADLVTGFCTTQVARSYVDVNRALDDTSDDGVTKMCSRWGRPVYAQRPPELTLREVAANYHSHYHGNLSAQAAFATVGLDCHTMASHGPPSSADAGRARPQICLGMADGTCPLDWVVSLRAELSRYFNGPITINRPLPGGYTIRAHAHELPWLQLAIVQQPEYSLSQQRQALFQALSAWCARVDGPMRYDELMPSTGNLSAQKRLPNPH